MAAVEFGVPQGMKVDLGLCEPCHTRGPVESCPVCLFRFCPTCAGLHERYTGHERSNDGVPTGEV